MVFILLKAFRADKYIELFELEVWTVLVVLGIFHLGFLLLLGHIYRHLGVRKLTWAKHKLPLRFLAYLTAFFN